MRSEGQIVHHLKPKVRKIFDSTLGIVAAGDSVWAVGEEGEAAGWTRVIRAFVTPDQPLLRLVFEDGTGERDTVRATPEHPFWSTEGWIAASDLRPGDPVLSVSRGWVRPGTASRAPERALVFDLEVAESPKPSRRRFGRGRPSIRRPCPTSRDRVHGLEPVPAASA